MPESEYIKIKYAELLSASDEGQVVEHLNHVNKKGELVYLVSGVINFWMDNASNIDNAKNADLALCKLAKILYHLESDVIESILLNLHQHTVKDTLSEFLLADINSLIKIYHDKQSNSTGLEFCFLMNFIDHEHLLEVLARLSGQEISNILAYQKNKQLLVRSLSHILDQANMYKDVFVNNNNLIILLSAMSKDVMHGKEVIELTLSNTAHDLLKKLPTGQGMANSKLSIREYTVLQLVNNFVSMNKGLQSLCQENVMPVLMQYPAGELFAEVISQNSLSDLKISEIKKTDDKLMDKLASEINSKYQKFLDQDIKGAERKNSQELIAKFESYILDDIKAQLSSYKIQENIKASSVEGVKKSANVEKQEDKDKGKIR